MPRPRKATSSWSSTSTIRKKNQVSGNSLAPKQFFNETIEVLDSDDDFVIPNPSIRVRLSENSYRQRQDADATAASPICGANSKSSTKDTIAGTGFGRDFSNTTVSSSVGIGKKFTFKPKTAETSDVKGTQQKKRKIVADESNYILTEDIKPTTDSWKDLMQRMQLNQKTNLLPLTSKKSNKSLKLTRNKPVIAKKVVSPLPKPRLQFQKERDGSPPKKLKMDPIDIIIMDEIDGVDKLSISQSTSLVTLPSGNDTLNNIPSSATNASLNPVPPKKIPDIFLKPEERAAIIQAQKQERSLVQIDLSDALKELSTEPEIYDSAIATNDAFFDDNIVKLNETITPNPYNKTKQCPFYKKLPGTRFSVDAFNYGLIPGVEVYFLSHFHSDHYMGLSKKFCKTLVCSPPTANLVRMKFNVDEHCIRRLQINMPYIIDEVEVTLINANHCPGSVMFIFRLQNGITFFHTGDFRFTVDMLDNHNLRDLRVDCLYLDTTYCDPQYDFPTQSAAIVELITVVKRRLEVQPKTLIICGTYVIGKERVYLSLAEAIGATVYMNSEKRGIIRALENPKYLSYLADKEDFASIHVHQMFGINPKFLSEYLNSRTNRYTHIIGIKPTGWQFSSSGDGSAIKSFYNNTVTIIGVPYSEHSSFSELEQFVRAMKPSKVQPTVNVGSVVKRENMMIHINKWLTN